MSGSSTRDWLLDKLLKLRQAMSEMKADYQQQLAAKDLILETAGEELSRACRSVETYSERNEELRDRIRDLSTPKGYKVVYRGSTANRLTLNILAVEHSQGYTTITVERP